MGIPVGKAFAGDSALRRSVPALVPRCVRHLCVLLIATELFLCCNGKKPSSGPPPAPRAKDTISLGFYNVENLFDLHFDGAEYPEYRPGALGWNKQTFEKKVANIAAALGALDADVVGLCEVENRPALEALRSELEREGKAYPFAAIADLPNRTVTCPALLSRLPIIRSQGLCAGSAGEAGRRNILEADVDCGGTTLKLFVNHWPAKAHPESQRVAVATSLAKRLAQLAPGTDYVVLGDLNADYDEWRKSRTEGLDDTKERTGINHVLRTVHGIPGRFGSYVNEADLCSGDSALHYDLWLELPEKERRSLSYHGLAETPDHILLPRALFDHSGLSYLTKSFSVFTWEGRLLRAGEPFGWQMRGYGKRRFHVGEGYSDHLPLRACLIKKPFACDSAASGGPGAAQTADHARGAGFERSMEGWMACGGAEVSRDSTFPASGRYCLRIAGGAQEQNGCGARTVIRADLLNRSRWARIAFDFRGSGKCSLRIRSGHDKWQCYNGGAFVRSGSVRYLPVSLRSWKHVAVLHVAENALSRDIEIELRAGKGVPFCFYIDNVEVR